MIDLSPSFFLCFERHRTWSVSCLCCFPLVRSLCPSDVVRSPLPVLLVVCLGVGRGVVCRAVVRCGVAYRSSLVSRVGRLGGVPAFLVSILSAVGGSLALRGSSRLIGAEDETGVLCLLG